MESKKMNRRENKARGRIARRRIFLILLLILGVSTVLASFTNPTVSITSVSQTSVYRGSSTTISGSYGSGQGNFLSFDGTDDYVKVPNSASLNLTSAVTVEAWFYTSVVRDGVIVWKAYTTHLPTYGISYFGSTYNALSARVADPGGTNHEIRITWSPDGKWHHVVMTYDGSVQKAYLDGVLKGTSSWSGSIATSTYDVVVGDRETLHAYFKGLIAHVRVYNRALSQDEILWNFRNPNSPVTNGLVLWLKMNEGTGTTVYDYSGYGNNGAVYNGTSLGATWVTSASPVTSVYVNITSPAGAVITNGLATLSNPLRNGTWSYTFTTSASSVLGSYSVSAKAIDLSGNYSIASLSNAFTVLNNPPSVSITSPTPSSVYRGNSVSITGSYGDWDGHVTGVYVNITDSSGTLVVTNGLATLSNPSGNGTWNYTFTTTASSRTGSYSITVKAVDNDYGSATKSLSNAFYVFNNPPTIYGTGVDPATRQVGNTLTLWVNASDYETFPLSGTATITDPNGNKISIPLQYKATTKRYEALYTPLVAGSYSVSFTVSDADSASASSSYSFIAVTSPIIGVSDQTATYNYNGVTVSAVVNYADHYYFYYQANDSIDGYTVINSTAKQIYKTYRLPAGTYTITLYASNSATGQTTSKSFTLTISKATPSLSLSLPSSVRWMDGFTITASESNLGDNDVVYKTFINNTYLGGIGTFSVQEASGLYVVKLNATEGQNYTRNEITQQITVLKAWEKTDSIYANASYHYDLGKTAVPVVAYQKNSRPANGTVIAGRYLYILSDITATNTNGNTGLQSTFTNIYINTTAPSGFRSIPVLIPSLSYNQQVSLTATTGKAVTAYGKSYSCTTGRCTYILTVNESVYTPNLPIAYTLPYPPPNWHIRRDYTVYIDGKITGFTFYPDNLTVVVPTTFSSSSSLGAGDHNTTVVYTTLTEQIEEANQSIISKLSDLLRGVNLSVISQLGSVNISLADLIKSANLNITNLIKNTNMTLADLIKSSNLTIIRQILNSTGNITVYINGMRVGLENRLSDILKAIAATNSTLEGKLSDILNRLRATSTRGTISLPAIPSPSFLAFANLPAITVSTVVMALLVFLFGILLYKKYREGK